MKILISKCDTKAKRAVEDGRVDWTKEQAHRESLCKYIEDPALKRQSQARIQFGHTYCTFKISGLFNN
ncbi:MAG: hypothetical protein WC319_09240 [Candidatus Paceibacterota bacterium]|jgi:hypothetical protein